MSLWSKHWWFVNCLDAASNFVQIQNVSNTMVPPSIDCHLDAGAQSTTIPNPSCQCMVQHAGVTHWIQMQEAPSHSQRSTRQHGKLPTPNACQVVHEALSSTGHLWQILFEQCKQCAVSAPNPSPMTVPPTSN